LDDAEFDVLEYVRIRFANVLFHCLLRLSNSAFAFFVNFANTKS
jgi:hypothetical protein